MKRILTIKAAIILGILALVLVAGGAYAITAVFDKNVTGMVQVVVSGDDAIQV